ncbi:McrB family protein [Paraburkholderia silvatlantica]|uniref:McrB family protein n=1 Tax=Paraburkholderia silvatlantica TaxID=321895 RepID=UPI0037518EA7
MDLQEDDVLVAAANQALAARRNDPRYRKWTEDLAAHVAKVQQANENVFRSVDFQQILWDSEAISATGQGFIATRPFWTDAAIVDRLWAVRNLRSSLEREALTQELQRLWDEVTEQIQHRGSKVPRLKLARVFAALQPRHFTSLADGKALDSVGKSMHVGRLREGRAALNQRILNRLDSVWPRIEASQDEPSELMRMKLPWLLFKREGTQADEEVTTDSGDAVGQSQLRPLPATRRRRGMLAIAGSMSSVLAMLQFVKDGCSREDFREHVRAVNPKLSAGSVNTNINALIAEWGVLTADGNNLKLTSRGMAFLESGDPDDVSDWMLTQILGFDNLLYLLRQGPREQKSLISDLQQVNPGWKTNFAPTALIGWLRAMELVEFTTGKNLALTARGKDWASRIHWEPGKLAAVAMPTEPALPLGDHAPSLAFQRPSVDQILAQFSDALVFNRSLIAQLDAALWSHERRHFAILSGLSGSGKTQLARSYGRALRGQSPTATEDGVYVLPVQPGWHDPSPLLGYVNPLNTERYVRTSFLNFLLDAVRDPERPYTVVLDEMNLSHPEQYLAPLLSTMETGDQIDLHAQDDDVDEIPSRVTYPSNLLIIGTVNMDETTHGLSDKVLDRASVIEFWDIDTDAFPGWGSCGLNTSHIADLKDILKQLGAALRPARLHFGWRTVGDVIGYVRAALAGGAIGFRQAVDHAVYGKILPKLRGEDSPRLRTALTEAKKLLDAYQLPMSLEKVTQLSDDLVRLGSARFWR